MLLGSLLLTLLSPVPQPPAAQPPEERAECLRTCAGAPKEATGQHLMACLQGCERAPTDGGVTVLP